MDGRRRDEETAKRLGRNLFVARRRVKEIIKRFPGVPSERTRAFLETNCKGIEVEAIVRRDINVEELKVAGAGQPVVRGDGGHGTAEYSSDRTCPIAGID